MLVEGKEETRLLPVPSAIREVLRGRMRIEEPAKRYRSLCAGETPGAGIDAVAIQLTGALRLKALFGRSRQ